MSILFEFQVMMQPHNRHMSFSLYISALTVSDTVVLLIGNKYFYFESKTLFNFFITTQKLLLVINKNTFQ